LRSENPTKEPNFGHLCGLTVFRLCVLGVKAVDQVERFLQRERPAYSRPSGEAAILEFSLSQTQ
jgi:hypothetical protein